MMGKKEKKKGVNEVKEQPDSRTRGGLKSQAGNGRWTQGCVHGLVCFVCSTGLNKVYTKGTGRETGPPAQQRGRWWGESERSVWQMQT